MRTANRIVNTALVMTVALVGVCSIASAQVPLEVLHTFSGETGPTRPYRLIQGADGNFYGTTSEGGVFHRGTIFRMTPAGVLEVLHAFTDLERSASTLIQAADGNFYGTTGGGAQDQGTFFSMSPAGAFTTLHTFSFADGAGPNSLIQASDGSFYGTTESGGPGSLGTVFRITRDGALTQVHAFGSGPEGVAPVAIIQAADGDFYGVTGAGSLAGIFGTAFRMTPGGVVTVLHAFTGGADGAMPAALIQGADGDFYGSTGYGSTSGYGTVFKMTSSGVVTILHGFAAASDGATPANNLVRTSDGSLYGTTSGGAGLQSWTLFKVNASGDFGVVHAFPGVADTFSASVIVLAADGSVYGTSANGGDTDGGMIFRAAPDGAFDVRRSFDGGPDGAFAVSGLLQGRDGNFYGTTTSGGVYDDGTIFKMTATGAMTEMHQFAGGPDGANPGAALIQAADGDFYGTTFVGGTFNRGTVFRMTPSGTVTILHAFTPGADGSYPISLTQGRNGVFYGVVHGEAYLTGAIFSMTAGGAVTVLHAFDSEIEGADPSPLVLGTDGNFYGTTSRGSKSFRMTPAGQLTVLHNFAAEEGFYPGALMQARDGNFYGATMCNGKFFRMTPAGSVTVLAPHTGFCYFFRTFLVVPTIALIQGRDGIIYGAGSGPGFDHGTVFTMTAAGTVTLLHAFTGGSDGDGPLAPPFQAADGNLYGTTGFGGALGSGVVFRLNPHSAPVAPTISFAAPAGNGAVTLTWSVVSGATSYTIRRIARGGGETVVARGVAGTSYTDTTALPGLVYTYVITAVNADGESARSNAAGAPVGLTSRTPTVTTIGDYDGDHVADLTVYRVPTGQWVTHRSHDGGASTVGFGGAAPLQDRPVPADYDGDGVTDLAVYRQTTGDWFVHRSSDDKTEQVGWGSPALGDVPVPADYDGDGRADLAVYRAATGEWFIHRSSDGTLVHLVWGSATDGDLPVPGDYDGDGQADIAVYRGTTGEWFILRSSDGALVHLTWGAPLLGDVPVPADYDGDGHADIAVYRGTTGEWFLHRSSDGVLVQFGWGAPLQGDVPVPGDYDGDGRQDVAVFREQTGEWFIHRSSDGGLTYWPFWGSPALGDFVRPY